MLRAPLLRRRGLWPTWSSREAVSRARSHGANRAQPLSSYPGRKDWRTRDKRPSSEKAASREPESKKLSLIEQLFPEESKRYEEVRERGQREIPRLPLEMPAERKLTPTDRLRIPHRPSESRNALRSRRVMESQAPQTSVLLMQNASKNLTEEDFTRLIPQGQHMEGWTLADGDIQKVIPGRNLATLEQENFYYLVFSTPLSAFEYQGHATRISRLVAEQTPDSLHTALAPTPGFTLHGMDVHAAIQAYTLTSSTQPLKLRQLKPPLSPLVASVIEHGGYSAILNRPDRMPYEVRLTLEGPQLPISRIRYIVYESGRDRALGWSGGEEANVKISKYEPKVSSLTASESDKTAGVSKSRTEQSQLRWDMVNSQVSFDSVENSDIAQRRRTSSPVYILGFHTEHAAQSFIRHWHRKPMEWGSKKTDSEDDLAPIASAELLW